MATKFNIAALGAVLAVLAAPGVASAQESWVPSKPPQSQSQINRFVRKIPYNAFGSVGSPGRRAFETDRDSRDCRPGAASEVCARSYRT